MKYFIMKKIWKNTSDFYVSCVYIVKGDNNMDKYKYLDVHGENMNMVNGVIAGQNELTELLEVMSDSEYEEAVVYIAHYILDNQGTSGDEKWLQVYQKCLAKVPDDYTNEQLLLKIIESLVDIEYDHEWTDEDEIWWQHFLAYSKKAIIDEANEIIAEIEADPDFKNVRVTPEMDERLWKKIAELEQEKRS